MSEKTSRRGYVKYAGAGIIVVAVAGAGAYYGTRQPAPSPTPTPTPGPTEVATVTKVETVVTGEEDELPKFNGARVNIGGTYVCHHDMVEIYKDEIKEKLDINLSTTDISFYDEFKLPMLDLTTTSPGEATYDIISVCSGFQGDFIGTGNVVGLDQWVKAYGGEWDTQEEDIIPAYRYILQETGQEEMVNEGKKMCGIAFDGDNMLMYYRKDLMTDEEKDDFKSQYGYELRAPETWDEFRDVSEFYTRKKGETLAGEKLTTDFYGNAQLCDKFQNNTWFLSRFGSGMGQGPPQPLYWDENMEPAFNGEIGQLALEDWVESVKPQYAMPGTTSFDYMAQRAAGLGGEVFMWISWGADGKGAQDPVHSRVVGKLGFGHVPGSWSKDKSEIIYAPVIQFNRAFLINKNAVDPEAAFHAARILTDPEHCLIYNWAPWSATEPVRYSAFEDPEKVQGIIRRAGYSWDLDELKEFMEAIKWAIEKGYPDYPYIEGTTEYQNSLNYHCQQAVLGEETVKQALDAAADEWRSITDKIGFEKQKGNWLRTQEIYGKAGLKLK